MKLKKIYIIGILGGIGSGKSVAAEEFEKLDCAVINADRMAQEYLGQPKVIERLKDIFGQNIINTDGKPNRKVIAEQAFSDGDKLSQLNNLIHPYVMEQTQKLIDQYKKENKVKAIVLDIPLLLEVGWEKKCDFLIFIDCLREKRLARAEKKGILLKNQLDLRENFQISLDKKRKIAHYIINNNSDLSNLRDQVERIFSDLVNQGG